MKHLIVFLNYCQSRIQNPVYRQFANMSLASRNASLLFLSKSLEERELLHEVNELRRKEEVKSDVSFHICCLLDQEDRGRQIMQTLTLIRKCFPSSQDLSYRTFAYCQLPDLNQCSTGQRNAAWKSLVSINNAVNDYIDVNLLNACFLYNDDSQQSLAQFLVNITQHTDLCQQLCKPLVEGSDFPPVFATFNATGINYPDDEVRYHLHQAYLHALLSYSQVDNNPVDMETCNQQAETLLSLVPLDNSRVCFQEDTFIDINSDTSRRWDVPSSYWAQAIDLSSQGLADLPREEWLRQISNRVEVLFQSRFRDLGVEFFFNLELKKTTDYAHVLFTVIQQELEQTMLRSPYPPSVLKDIVHAIVNRLQQKVIELNQLHQQTETRISALMSELNGMVNRWNSMGIFDRLRGRNTQLLEQYKQQLQHLFELRTLLPGCHFATKLLNELIPQVAALSDGSDRLTSVCQEALATLHRNLEESQPASLSGIFPIEPVRQAVQALTLDREHLSHQYLQVVNILYDKSRILDGEDLLQRLRTNLSDHIDHYLTHRIQDGTLPAVIDVTIVDRLASLYNNRGGLPCFIDELKQSAAFTLLLKDESGQIADPSATDVYQLVAPENENLGPHIKSRNGSQLQILHFRLGLSLQDLDGFTGKRMFVEPSLF